MSLPHAQLGADGFILEGLVTTHNPDGSVNLSPMGPLTDTACAHFLFRPYPTSTTYQNLQRTGHGVFHLTDDVLLFAQAAVGQPDPQREGLRLVDCCRWFEFRVEALEPAEPRVQVWATTIAEGRCRDFLGFQRAKHAVIEAAILASRVHVLPAEQIAVELERLRPLVEKTASLREQHAFDFLVEYVQQSPLLGKESRP